MPRPEFLRSLQKYIPYRTKVKTSWLGDEIFVRRKVLSDKVLSDKVLSDKVLSDKVLFTKDNKFQSLPLSTLMNSIIFPSLTGVVSTGIKSFTCAIPYSPLI